MATKSISEVNELVQLHTTNVRTYGDLLHQMEQFSQKIEHPFLYSVVKEKIDLFSKANFRNKKSTERKAIHKLRQIHSVTKWVRVYDDPICIRTYDAIDQLVQEEIRNKTSELSQGDLHTLAACKSSFFKELRKKMLLSSHFV